MVWADQVAVIRSGLPKVTDGLCQESENAPSLLEVGDRRGLAVERRQEFGMKRVVLDDLSLILGAGRPLGKVGALFDHLGEVADVLFSCLFGSLMVHVGEHAMADDGTDLVLGGRRQNVLLAQFIGFLAEGI